MPENIDQTIADIIKAIKAGKTENDKKAISLISRLTTEQLNMQDENGATLLHHAAGMGRNKIVESLLAKGVDYVIKDNLGKTPLHYATQIASVECVNTLLENNRVMPIEPDKNGKTPFVLAMKNNGAFQSNRTRIAEKLIASGLDVDSWHNWGSQNQKVKPIHIAVLEDLKELVKLLAKKPGVDINERSDLGTPIEIAIKNADTAMLNTIIKGGAKLDNADPSGFEPIHHAIESKYPFCTSSVILGIIPSLLNQNTINALTKDGRNNTPLHLTVQNGYEDVAKKLLDTKANPDIRNNGGYTALHYATIHKLDKTVQNLLDAKANPNISNNEGNNALHYATIHQRESDVKKLLEAKANVDIVNNEGKTSLDIANNQGEIGMTNVLKNIQTSLNKAKRDKDLAYVKNAVEGKENVNALDERGNTALHYATIYQLESDVKKLLDAKANVDIVNNEGKTPLDIANNQGEIGMTNVFKNIQTSLNKAKRDKDLAYVKNAVEGKENVNALDERGNTALHYATIYQLDEEVQKLLDANANVYIRNKDGNTALHYATIHQRNEVVQKLLDANANPNISNNEGNTPLDIANNQGEIGMIDVLKNRRTSLHKAICNKDLANVVALLEKKVNVDIPDADGNTPLHLATLYGLESVVQDLLKAKANPDILNNEGETALDIAKRQNDEGITKALESESKKSNTSKYGFSSPFINNSSGAGEGGSSSEKEMLNSSTTNGEERFSAIIRQETLNLSTPNFEKRFNAILRLPQQDNTMGIVEFSSVRSSDKDRVTAGSNISGAAARSDNKAPAPHDKSQAMKKYDSREVDAIESLLLLSQSPLNQAVSEAQNAGPSIPPSALTGKRKENPMDDSLGSNPKKGGR